MYILFTLPQRIRAGCDQCANNLRQPDGALPQRIRAGCDQSRQSENTAHPELCHSAFARVATAACKQEEQDNPLCHSAFVRVATFPALHPFCGIGNFATAHSCGLRRNKLINACNFVTLCHSAFARVATTFDFKLKSNRKLCHSAFARVATELPLRLTQTMVFATAHSCGLRLRKSNAAHCEFAARR